ncbi:MAG: EAL domain-containing protein, partial [Trueperaceae bacterium]|nr:EAL domain-containing protein [Trueperaceae bacterium]
AAWSDLDVVAEGIETTAQLELVQSLGCHLGQGYYFAKPMAPDRVEAYLRRDDVIRTDERAVLFN